MLGKTTTRRLPLATMLRSRTLKVNDKALHLLASRLKAVALTWNSLAHRAPANTKLRKLLVKMGLGWASALESACHNTKCTGWKGLVRVHTRPTCMLLWRSSLHTQWRNPKKACTRMGRTHPTLTVTLASARTTRIVMAGAPHSPPSINRSVICKRFPKRYNQVPPITLNNNSSQQGPSLWSELKLPTSLRATRKTSQESVLTTLTRVTIRQVTGSLSQNSRSAKRWDRLTNVR